MAIEVAQEDNPFQLEGQSRLDRAWYDCEVRDRGGQLFMRFNGYNTDEEEPLTDLGSIRFSSLAAEPTDCHRLLPGARVTGYKRSPKDALWVDAEVTAKRGAAHARGECACSFTVRWLDTADAGQQAKLRIGDLCLLDERQLSQHPQYEQYRAALAGRRPGGAAARRPRARHSNSSSSPEAIPETDAEDERPDGGRPPSSSAQPEQARPRAFRLRPPMGASGPRCALCALPTLLESDPGASELCEADRRDLAGLYAGRHVVHRRCAAFSGNAGLNYPARYSVGSASSVAASSVVSFSGGVGEALTQKCRECGNVGATARCSQPQCRTFFHLHCAEKCSVHPDEYELKCPAHSALSGVKAQGLQAFYGNGSTAARKAELERLASGRGLVKRRLEGLERPSAKRRTSARTGNKHVWYDEKRLAWSGMSEGWQKGIGNLGRRRSTESDSDEGEEDEHSQGEGSGDSGIQYADESEEEEDEAGLPAARPGRWRGARRGQGAAQAAAQRRPQRNRTQVKSYAEVQEELELKMEAYRQAERQKSGYEQTRCEVCDSKARGKEMLLCDGCDRGFHMFCLEPPLREAPLAFWFCSACLPHQCCEKCGLGGRAGGGAKRKAAASQQLAYCTTCGALCHAGCMQREDEDGGPRCELCCEGLQEVEAVLGCRTPAARHGRKEYFVKWKGRGYRQCRWVTDAAAARMAPAQLQRFCRDSRDADSVEPNVQEGWLQVERVVARREEGGRQEVLVKWRGLEYDKATWEPLEGLQAEEEQELDKFERRMALRVERDDAAEAAARRCPPPPLRGQPGFLAGAGTLKDYQLEGVGYLLSNLAGLRSVILGDEMGLGKTCQTAVALQLAREAGLLAGPAIVAAPLSTIGSWERELRRWAPGLEVLCYTGPQEARSIIRRYELGSEEDDMDAVRRKASALVPRFHVLLTTYDVAIKDESVLRRFRWSAMVLDEGHCLKGENSKRGAVLRELGAPWRLLLTGTPLQNNLRELLALLAFMEGRSIEEVERRVKRLEDPAPPGPGDGGDDEELRDAQAYIRKLHAYLEPRMLRRMKASCLAGQMPPKITRKVACRMTPLQLQLYLDLLAKDWDRVHAMVRNRLEKKSMNNILIRLRQACMHPYLLPGQEPEEFKDPASPEVAEQAWRLMVAASGKLTLLQQLLPRLLAGGHRVLLFSQSVEMLDILEDFLFSFQDPTGLLPAADDAPQPSGAADPSSNVDHSGEGGGGSAAKEEGEGEGEEEDYVRGRRGSVIRYFRLDGSTKGWQRQAMMDSFNSLACKVRVFLISTRAGSLGINLQTANTVVLLDPDFNPFVDAQAEGRAHRLGQEETVLVYQLYTAASVEERILALAARKRKLEELVTRHLGRARDVSDDDMKSSVLHGWGNLMRQKEEAAAGAGGAECALGDAELARLLDRERVYADDVASGADAAALLGEVRAGGAAAMKFDGLGGGDGDGGGGGGAGQDAEMEAAMLRLIQERARKYEADKAAQQELGRGRRARGGAVNYCVGGASMEEWLGPEDGSPEKKGRGSKGKRRAGTQSGSATSGGGSDGEYNPLTSPGLVPARAAGGNGGAEDGPPGGLGALDALAYSSDSSWAAGSESDSEARPGSAPQEAKPPSQPPTAKQAPPPAKQPLMPSHCQQQQQQQVAEKVKKKNEAAERQKQGGKRPGPASPSVTPSQLKPAQVAAALRVAQQAAGS